MAAACALIPAAGRGVRFGGARNKVLTPLLGRPLLGWTLEAFARSPEITHIVLIGAEGELETLWEIGELYGGEKFTASVLGGATRQESVRLGLEMVPVECDTVVIHDAARCCVTPKLIADVLYGARTYGPASAMVRVADSLLRFQNQEDFPDKRCDTAVEVDRNDLFAVQTPQAFATEVLREAHQAALQDEFVGTDDLSLVRRILNDGYWEPVSGSPENLKVTTPEDLKLAEAILRSRGMTPSPNNGEQEIPRYRGQGGNSESPIIGGQGVIRIGQGYDVHQLAEGRECWLGGVHFPEAKLGPIGHSDADVLLHAICDALLGAAGLGDIGKLFPPSDMAHKDRRSIEFLEEIKAMLDEGGWQVSNIDATVLAEAPKVLPRAAEIRSTIAEALEILPEQVSVKATTNEGMGFIGRGEGIAAHATALLRR